MENPMYDKFDELKKKFDNDPTVQDLIAKLRTRYSELEGEAFSEEDMDSLEFEDMSEELYCGAQEDDPNEIQFFDVLWFT
jgi:hypothetical protein